MGPQRHPKFDRNIIPADRDPCREAAGRQLRCRVFVFAIPQDASGYPALVEALSRITTPANVREIAGENWLRVLGRAKAA